MLKSFSCATVLLGLVSFSIAQANTDAGAGLDRLQVAGAVQVANLALTQIANRQFTIDEQNEYARFIDAIAERPAQTQIASNDSEVSAPPSQYLYCVGAKVGLIKTFGKFWCFNISGNIYSVSSRGVGLSGGLGGHSFILIHRGPIDGLVGHYDGAVGTSLQVRTTLRLLIEVSKLTIQPVFKVGGLDGGLFKANDENYIATFGPFLGLMLDLSKTSLTITKLR